MVANLAEAKSHNVPPETFLAHYRTIRDATRAKDEAGMALTRAKKAAKGDGIDLDAFKMLEKLAKLDADEAEIQLRHMREYAQWLNLPLGAQLDMFGKAEVDQPTDKAAAEQRAWAAEEAGYESGKAGGSRTDDNGYEPGSELHARFDKGFLRGQRTLADKLGENAKSADPTRWRRGRPPGPGRTRANGSSEDSAQPFA